MRRLISSPLDVIGGGFARRAAEGLELTFFSGETLGISASFDPISIERLLEVLQACWVCRRRPVSASRLAQIPVALAGEPGVSCSLDPVGGECE